MSENYDYPNDNLSPQPEQQTRLEIISSQLNTIIDLLTNISNDIYYLCNPQEEVFDSFSEPTQQDDSNYLEYEQQDDSESSENVTKNDLELSDSNQDSDDSHNICDTPISDDTQENLSDVESTESSNELYLSNYFSEYGFNVSEYLKYEDIPEVLLKTAIFIGTNFEDLKPLLKILKANVSMKKGIDTSLKNYSSTAISAVCSLCSELNKLAFLEEYKYSRSPKFLLHTRSSASPEYISFITGKWLEYYIMHVTQTITNSFNIPYWLVSSLILRSEENGQIEFDVVLTINSQLYWIECKTGDYQAYIKRYTTLGKNFSIPKDHSFLVLCGTDDETCKSLKQVYKLNVCSLNTFNSEFKNALNSNLL